MWYFHQLRAVKLHYSVYGKLLLITTIAHIFVLIFLFGVYRSSHDHIMLVIDQKILTTDHDLTLSFVPVLHKKPPIKNIKSPTVQQKESAPAKQSSMVKTTTKNESNNTTKNNQPKKGVSIANATKQNAKPISPKKPEKQVEKKTEQPKTTLVKSEVIKKEPEISKKQIQQSPIAPQKKEEPLTTKKTIVTKDMPKPIDPIKQPLPESITQEDDLHIVASSTESTIIEATPQEIETYHKVRVLQQELVRVWQPPQAITHARECTISVAVDWQGIITQTTIEQSSNVLAYDVAARSAIYQMNLPEWMKGKTFTIVFKM